MGWGNTLGLARIRWHFLGSPISFKGHMFSGIRAHMFCQCQGFRVNWNGQAAWFFCQTVGTFWGNIFVGCESAGDEWWPGGAGDYFIFPDYSEPGSGWSLVSRGKVNTRPNINLEWTQQSGIMGAVRLLSNWLCLCRPAKYSLITFDLIENLVNYNQGRRQNQQNRV